MGWIGENYKWLFDGIGGLLVVGTATWIVKQFSPRLKPFRATQRRDVASTEKEMGRILFDYLPGSPLLNGWRTASNEKASLKASVPPDRPDGLAIEAEDAIDCDVEKYQRVCNRVQFVAKLRERSHVYVRIQLVSRDGVSVSRAGWVACDIGDRPPRKESRDEWVIHRTPQSDGWTVFDLFLPEEVSRTFGQAEGLRFSELLGFRLRGSLSVSPIRLLRRDPPAISADASQGTIPGKRERWSRGEKIGVWSLLLAALAIAASLVVPESRRYLGLDNTSSVPSFQPAAIAPPTLERSGNPPIAANMARGAADAQVVPSKRNLDPSRTAAQKAARVTSPNNSVAANNNDVGDTQSTTAVAPNGIANTAPNFGTQTINNNLSSPEESIAQVRADATSLINRLYVRFRSADDFATAIGSGPPLSSDKQRDADKKRFFMDNTYENFSKEYERDFKQEALDVHKALMGHIRVLPRRDHAAEETYKQYPQPPGFPPIRLNVVEIEIQLWDLRALLNEMERENNLPLSCQDLVLRFGPVGP